MEESFKVPSFPTKEAKPEEKPAAEPEIPYRVPKWSGETPPETYSFEVLKNGVIVEEVKHLQDRPYWMIGRLLSSAGVHITAAHPTVSRYHAVLQYKDPSTLHESESDVQGGWFVYDLGKLTDKITDL